MVDFNSEATVGTPAIDIVRVMVLERLNNVIDAYEDYVKKNEQGYEKDLSIIKARLKSLWLILEAQIKRKDTMLKKEDRVYDKIKSQINSNDAIEIDEAITFFNNYLDDIKLTRLDTKKVYDKTIAEIENKTKGLN